MPVVTPALGPITGGNVITLVPTSPTATRNDEPAIRRVAAAPKRINSFDGVSSKTERCETEIAASWYPRDPRVFRQHDEVGNRSSESRSTRSNASDIEIPPGIGDSRNRGCGARSVITVLAAGGSGFVVSCFKAWNSERIAGNENRVTNGRNKFFVEADSG